MKKMLLFQVGTVSFGIELTYVRSIQSVKHILDHGKESREPMVRILDDQLPPLYDLVSIFEEETVARDLENEKLIMVETERQIVGMIVTCVDQVVTVDIDLIKPIPPIFKGVSRSCFPEVLKHDDALILLLAPKGIRKVGREAGNEQNSTNTSVCKDAFPDVDDTIELVNEVSSDSDNGRISFVDHWAQDSDIYESLKVRTNPQFRRPAKDVEIVDMVPEIIDASEIDDDSQCESASFLMNFLQSNGELNED
jgi:chemotaxis signal transduction protein